MQKLKIASFWVNRNIQELKMKFLVFLAATAAVGECQKIEPDSKVLFFN
jgi:hypothetical protein